MSCLIVPTAASDSILDAKIVNTIQPILAAELSWLEKCFGLAEIAEMKQDGGDILRFPRVPNNDHSERPTYTDVRYDDSLKSLCFFERDGEISFGGEEGEYDGVTYPLAIVFWCNLERIDVNRAYDFTDQLVGHVINVLRYNFDSNIAHNIGVELRSEQAYSNYSMRDVDNRFITLPYTAFRISFTYTEFQSGSCYEFEPLTGIGYDAIGTNTI